MLSGLCRRSQIVMAAKVTDHQAAQEVFGSMGKRVLNMITFAFEFFLDTIIQFLVDNRRIDPGISIGSLRRGLGIDCNLGSRYTRAERSRDEDDPRTMALVGPGAFVIKRHRDGFIS